MTIDTSRSTENAGPDYDPDLYVIQDGVAYSWSESNMQYERAWWLYADMATLNYQEKLRVNRLLTERPYRGKLQVPNPLPTEETRPFTGVSG